MNILEDLFFLWFIQKLSRFVPVLFISEENFDRVVAVFFSCWTTGPSWSLTEPNKLSILLSVIELIATESLTLAIRKGLAGMLCNFLGGAELMLAGGAECCLLAAF